MAGLGCSPRVDQRSTPFQRTRPAFLSSVRGPTTAARQSPSYIPPSGISASSPDRSHPRPYAAGPASAAPPTIAPGISSPWREPCSVTARNVGPPVVPAHFHKLHPLRLRIVY